MNDSADAGSGTFFSLFYVLHGLVILCVVAVGVVLRVKAIELERENDVLRGQFEAVVNLDSQYDELRKKSQAFFALDEIDFHFSQSALSSRLSSRIRSFSSVSLTKFLPDDFMNLGKSKAVDSDLEGGNKWIFAHGFEADGRYVVGVFSSRVEPQTLSIEVLETNSDYADVHAGLVEAKEIEPVKQGWNFLIFEIVEDEDDVRMTARVTDKTLQVPHSETLDLCSLKTLLNLTSLADSSEPLNQLWNGDRFGDRFVYCEQHSEMNPNNNPLFSLCLRSPLGEQRKHLRVDLRMSK